MAPKARKAANLPQPVAPLPQNLDLSGADDAGEDAAQGAIAQIRAAANEDTGGDWECSIYRVVGANRDGVKMPWLFDCDVTELRALRFKLAETYPEGGRYRIRVRRDSVLFRQFDLEIEKRIGSALPSWTPVKKSEEDMGGVVTVLDRMMARQEQFMEAMIARLATAPAPASLDNTIDTFVKLQALMPKGAQENSLDMFQKGMDFTAKLYDARGGGGGETNFMDLAREALSSPALKEILGAVVSGMQAGAQQPHPGQAALPPAQAAPTTAVGMWKHPQAINLIEMLCGQAAVGTQPELMASQLEQQLPAAVMDDLEQQDDIVGYLESMFPQIAPHRAWFAALVDVIFTAGDDDGPAPLVGTFADAGKNSAAPPIFGNPGRSGGDARNPQANAGPGLAGEN